MQPPETQNTPATPAAGTTPVQPEVPVKKSKLKLIIAAVAATVIIAGGVMAWQMTSKPSVDKVFNDMYEISLSTSYVKMTAKSKDYRATNTFDVSDVKNPKLMTEMRMTSDDGSASEVHYYSTFQDIFVKYGADSFAGMEVPDETTKKMVDKWTQVRKDGKLAEGSEMTMYSIGDIRLNAFGDFIFGKFKGGDKQKLLDQIKEKPIYSYKKEDVKKETLNGREVFVYKVTANDSNLVAFNKKAAEIMGTKLDKTVEDLLHDSEDDATYYVDIKAKRIVKVTGMEDGQKIEVELSYDNDAKIPAAPKEQIPFTEVLAIMEASSAELEAMMDEEGITEEDLLLDPSEVTEEDGIVL